ncbi:DUF4145 domain-containing protein [Nioella sp.]|uniref:DUF4145 domain-containing protein n=1 Tax=Nioella sp. TaxID=1912091 RepID=UPI003518EFA1
MSFQLTCGHCGVRSISRVVAHSKITYSGTDFRIDSLAKCDNCHRSSFVSFHVNTGYIYEFSDFEKQDVIIRVEDLRHAELFPVKESNIPDFLPNVLKDVVEDAEFNYHSNRWKTATQLYLQALEFACILIESDFDEISAQQASAQKTDITKRINSIFEGGSISASLKEWAHQIRVIGQYHKHRYVEADEDDCKDVRDFLDSFLRYSFTIPGQISARRERIRSAKTA